MHRQTAMPYYAGRNTFLRSPEKKADELREGEVGVVGVPIDFTSMGRKGQRWAPDAIRRESLYLAGYYHIVSSDMLDPATGSLLRLPEQARIFDIGDVNVDAANIEHQNQLVIESVSRIAAQGAFPLVLGGDHYVAYPSFEGFAAGYLQRHPGAKFGYLHLDSHTDFLDEIPGLGRLNHGTSARRVSENPNVKRMAWVGINWPALLDVDQYRVMEQRGFVIFSSESIRARGIESVMREALEFAGDGTDAVYVSLDIDICDGPYAPATHAPSFDGITSRQCLQAMAVLAASPKVRAVDVCEVLPQQESSQRTERLAALAMFTVVAPKILDIRPAEGASISTVFR
jgi:agmatinase